MKLSTEFKVSSYNKQNLKMVRLVGLAGLDDSYSISRGYAVLDTDRNEVLGFAKDKAFVSAQGKKGIAMILNSFAGQPGGFIPGSKMFGFKCRAVSKNVVTLV